MTQHDTHSCAAPFEPMLQPGARFCSGAWSTATKPATRAWPKHSTYDLWTGASAAGRAARARARRVPCDGGAHAAADEQHALRRARLLAGGQELGQVRAQPGDVAGPAGRAAGGAVAVPTQVRRHDAQASCSQQRHNCVPVPPAPGPACAPAASVSGGRQRRHAAMRAGRAAPRARTVQQHGDAHLRRGRAGRDAVAQRGAVAGGEGARFAGRGRRHGTQRACRAARAARCRSASRTTTRCDRARTAA